MLITKLKAGAVALLLLGMVAVAGGRLAIGRTHATETNAEQPAAKPNEAQGDKKDASAQAKKQETGKEVTGLVALAEVVEKPGKGLFEIRFSLKNVSDKDITICDCPLLESQVQVKWIGPDGKMQTSKHNNFPPSNFLLNKDFFVGIAPGEVRHIVPTIRFHTSPDKPGKVDDAAPKTLGLWEGLDATGIAERSNLAQTGEHRVTVSFANQTVSYPASRGEMLKGPNGKRIAVDHVWTGTVTAKEVTFKTK